MTEKEREKIEEDILKKREEFNESEDTWFKKYYLDDLERLRNIRNKFGISELKPREIESLNEGLKRFIPYACGNCGYNKKIPRRVFKIEKLPEGGKEQKELERYMERKYKIYYFEIRSELEMSTINAGICPRCGSQHVLFDRGLFIRKPPGWRRG